MRDRGRVFEKGKVAMKKSGFRVFVLATTLAAGIGFSAPVRAQVADVGDVPSPEPTKEESAWRFTAGLGIAILPDYVGSDDYTFSLLPKLRAQKEAYFVDVTGPYLTSNVLPSARWHLGPAAQFIKGGRCNVQDNAVNNMNCQSDAVMLGGIGGYNYPLTPQSMLAPKLRIMGDAAGANDGFSFEPMIDYQQRLSDSWGLLLRGNMIAGSDNYEDYYFGVSGPQSRSSGLRTYNADGGIQQLGLTAVGSYSLSDAIRFDLVGRYQRLVGDAEDSPLVDGHNGRGDANQFIMGVIASYSFGL